MISNIQNAILSKKYECIKCGRVFSPIYLEYTGNKFKCSCGCSVCRPKIEEKEECPN